MEKSPVFKAYTEFVWLNNREPHSIAEFCTYANIDPVAFKTTFGQFKNIRQQLLTTVFDEVWERVEQAAAENDYSLREKCLALFFTLAEAFGAYRDYLKTRYPLKELGALVEDWRPFNKLFVAKTQHFQQNERVNWLRDKLPGKLTDEVSSLLMGWNYVFRVWLADESEEQATTDAAIEKTVHLYFDLSENKQFEKVLDFGKFIATTKVRL
ncbi:hypothetical protein [Fluviicola sp.]|uniref:hypothetical protein n=1 Tax=Fluviicola sp. TaxID=1917219 RepID=UPI0031DE09C4